MTWRISHSERNTVHVEEELGFKIRNGRNARRKRGKKLQLCSTYSQKCAKGNNSHSFDRGWKKDRNANANEDDRDGNYDILE